jgi:SAM-dependent methyltransferase
LSKDIEDMLAVNAAQKQYYDVASGSSESRLNSPLTNAWRRLRTRALASVKAAGSARTLVPLHRQWIGDVAGKKVLELGVGGGSPLSEMLAGTAAEYVALDLSRRRLRQLRKRLKRAGIFGRRYVAADFLAPTEFPDDGFDVIYALSVFHHFAHLEPFLSVVEAKLAPGGIVVTYDPVQIWWPLRALRLLYRPFQTDAEWEYPFGERALRTIEKRFEVVACQGLLARAKWAAVISVFAPKLGARLAEKWHAEDLAQCTTPRSLRKSLHASYCLRKRAALL